MGSRPASRMEKHSVSVRIKWSSRWMFTSPSARAMLPVASMVGYEDASYFARAFKKRTGMTPTQYRKEAAKAAREARL